ncbi:MULTISPECIES: hypothetical protein [Corynebacterium]|uniref:hypothetical protein n=1 Tax=Corynebacterium TaxID=1716 RepID=UPI0011C97612|nr:MULTISPECIES: hypothetical protein [Corynebacterium]TXS64627.1 hypothetical protein CHU71_04380 [Corynebacterium sp. LK14]HAT1303606.1 hypothetical protein [Corynebacterium striatum]HAT1360261.1 hypothetical protein [Corynebacterium striatum]HAT1392307.1 hypothetical protein [Corynebacterium striatum]
MAAINLDHLLEKRREVVGDAHKFPVEFAGRVFHFVAPEIAGADWNDRHAELREDSHAGIISTEALRVEMAELMLEDEADDFINLANEQGVDPLSLIMWAVEDHNDRVGKTRSQRNLNRSQRRAKQR